MIIEGARLSQILFASSHILAMSVKYNAMINFFLCLLGCLLGNYIATRRDLFSRLLFQIHREVKGHIQSEEKHFPSSHFKGSLFA